MEAPESSQVFPCRLPLGKWNAKTDLASRSQGSEWQPEEPEREAGTDNSSVLEEHEKLVTVLDHQDKKELVSTTAD